MLLLSEVVRKAPVIMWQVNKDLKEVLGFELRKWIQRQEVNQKGPSREKEDFAYGCPGV